MKDSRQHTGRRGEQLAVEYLRRHGYRIHETNYRCSFGELDIVASEGKTLVFVEVRTRSGAGFGGAAESVNARKREKLRQVAAAFLQERYGQAKPPAILPKSAPGAPPDCRIDVVAITLSPDGGRETIELIRNAVGE